MIMVIWYTNIKLIVEIPSAEIGKLGRAKPENTTRSPDTGLMLVHRCTVVDVEPTLDQYLLSVSC